VLQSMFQENESTVVPTGQRRWLSREASPVSRGGYLIEIKDAHRLAVGKVGRQRMVPTKTFCAGT
jgi:hypothetical protein